MMRHPILTSEHHKIYYLISFLFLFIFLLQILVWFLISSPCLLLAALEGAVAARVRTRICVRNYSFI